MKAIIVYYSLDGNVDDTAENIAEILAADTLRLEPQKEYPTGKVSKFFWGGKSVMFGEKPKLKPYSVNLEEYDTIILGTPVWAGSFVPPLRTFIQESKLDGKKIALFACSSSGNANGCFQKLKKECGIDHAAAELSLVDPLKKQKEEDKRKIQDFVKKLKK